MADVFSASAAPAPITPVKAGTTVQTTEVAPEYSPAPQYTKSVVAHDPIAEALGASKKGGASIMPTIDHPVLPIGDVSYDIRNHLSCHSIFNTNIETLLAEYLGMKNELTETRAAAARWEREYKREKREKDDLKIEVTELERALRETRFDLEQTRSELTVTHEKLSLAIKQLADMAQRLEDMKNKLREAVRERDRLQRELEVKERELLWCMKRIADLQAALDLANKGESDANERNVRLTHLLYEVERQKAAIDRARDRAEAKIRELECDVESGICRHGPILAELEAKIIDLNSELARCTKQRDDALSLVHDRDNTISGLQSDMEELNKDIAKLRDDVERLRNLRNKFRNLVSAYEQVVMTLPKDMRRKFRGLRKRHGISSEEASEMLAFEVDELEPDDSIEPVANNEGQPPRTE